jgi:sugar-specific transcriptional regulator TrmB
MIRENVLESLQGVGLSKNESKIYWALIELGPSTIGEISSKTKIHRRNAYDSIERLEEKGFVSCTVENDRKYFEAINSERLVSMLDEKKEKIKSIMPHLLKRSRLHKPQNFKVYTGMEGRKIIFEDKLKFKETQLVLGAHSPSERSSRYIML